MTPWLPRMRGAIDAAKGKVPPSVPSDQDFDPELGEQSMRTGTAGALVAIVGMTLATFYAFPLMKSFRDKTFTVCIVVFFVMAAIELWAPGRARKKKWDAQKSYGEVFKGALWRFIAVLVLLGVFHGVYRLFPHYTGRWYNGFRQFLNVTTGVYAILGLPYNLYTLSRRGSTRADLNDVPLMLCLVGRTAWRSLRGKNGASLARLFRNRRTQIIGIGIMVKAFFLPLMVTFVSGNGRDFRNRLTGVAKVLREQEITAISDLLYMAEPYALTDALYHLGYAGLFMIDVLLVTIGYAITLRWLDNSIRSAEPTLSGWIACIACYKPFNDVTGWYFLWPRMRLVGMEDGLGKLAVQVAILLLLGVYCWATLAFGLRFSNLTHRGIVTRGPYQYVRHPAYISKNTAWWLEYLPSFTTLSLASLKAGFFMACWNGIYLLRALTEERHLGQDPAYRKYAEKVRWRLIPGIW